MFLAIVLAAGLAPVIPDTLAPESAYAEGAANSTVTITHQPVGGTFAKGSPVRLYVRASSSLGGLLTYEWHRSTDGTASDDDAAVGTGSICDDTPASNGTYFYYVVVSDAKTGQAVTSSMAKVEVMSRSLETALGNGDFSQASYEYAVQGNTTDIQASPYWTGYTQIPYWNTTECRTGDRYPRTIQRVVSSAFQSSNQRPTSDTNVGAELAGNMESCLYQEIATIPGKLFSWSLKHSARSSIYWNGGKVPAGTLDVMAVVIGPTVEGTSDYASYTSEYPYGQNDTGYLNGVVNQVAKEVTGDSNATGSALATYGNQQFTTMYQGKPYYVYITADPNNPVSEWGNYSGTYTVPEGQGATVFGFVSVKCPTSGTGNLLDDITFAQGEGVEIKNDVDYSGGGKVFTTVENIGFSYGIVEERGSTTMAVSAAVTLDGAPLPVNDKLGAGTSDWYTPGTTGELAFSDLTPGKTYRVVAVPTSAINTTLGSNLNPGLVLDEDYYESVTIKPVSDPADGSGGNIQATAEATADNKARIIVNPARADVEYALLKTDGTAKPVSPAQTVKEDCEWTQIKDGSGKLYFEGLDRSTSYAVVARPYGYSEIGYQSQVDAKSYVVVATPSDRFTDLSATDGSVERSEDGQTIHIKNLSGQKQRYTVYDALTGEAVTENGWQEVDAYNDDPGKIYEVSVGAAGADRAYQVSTAELDRTCAPSPGVRSFPPAPDPVIDFVKETVGDSNGVVPKTVEFKLQDNETEDYYCGSADAWEPGTDGSPMSLSAYLDTMKLDGAGATLIYRTHADYDDPAVYVVKEVVVPARRSAPDDPSAWYSFDYKNEKLIPGAGIPGIEARTSEAAEWMGATASAGLAVSKLNWTGSKRSFQLRLAAVRAEGETPGAFASASTGNALIPVRPSAPDVGVLLNEDGTTYHFIGDDVGASEYREYGTTGDYERCTGAVNLTKGKTYEVRRVASDDAFASYTLLRAASEAQLSATTPKLDDVVYGYAETPSATFTLTNPGKSPAVVEVADNTTDSAAQVVMVSAPDAYLSAHPGSSGVAAPAFTVTGDAVKLLAQNASGTPAVASAQETVLDSPDTDELSSPPEADSRTWTVAANPDLPAGVYEASITVRYKDGGESGDVSDYLTALCSVTLVVDKATPDAPEDFHVVEGSVTSTSLSLSATVPNSEPHPVGIEFSKGADYAPATPGAGKVHTAVLDDLNPATCYEFYARTAADANHNASTPVSLRACAAWAAPDANAVKFNYVQETISAVPAGCELRSSASDDAATLSVGSSVSAFVGKTLYLRHASTGEASDPAGYTPASDWVSVTVPDRPEVELALSATNATDSRTPDGTLNVSGVAEFQYRKLGDATWIPVQQGSSMALAAGAYEVRIPATGSSFASNPATQVIEEENYLVDFDAAGGTWEGGAAPATVSVKADGKTSVGAPSVTLTREGYEFAGWNKGDALWVFQSPVTSDTTLTAAWTANSYTVKFDANGGAGEPMADQPFVYDAAQALSACSYTREGYLFKGWSLVQGGAAEDPGAEPTVAYTDGQTVSNLASDANGTVTLFAVWARPAISAAVPINATVVVDANGDFVCPSPLDPANPDAGGYAISSTTPAALKVESVSFKLAEGATDVFTKAAKTKAVVNGLELAANDTDKTTAPFATSFTLAAAGDGKTTYRPLELSLTYPGGTMTYAKEARPFATLTYKLAFDDGAAASGEGA